ncbi:MAG TPA: prepilin-type N-terminal cleavage/methylation domain-containing protein [Chthonomonadaceae bacterium]|nr:prepilin-type N-terminal cleavage/methylation domain-containing protein [Chthonomonadaceae bacterium]
MKRYVKSARRARKGFTLVELLVVVLILAILMSLALPLYVSAVANSEKRTCRANMQTIANAVQAARVKTVAGSYRWLMGDVTTSRLPDLQAVPVCPGGGSYSIEPGSSGDYSTFQVVCTKHGTFEPGVDSN